MYTKNPTSNTKNATFGFELNVGVLLIIELFKRDEQQRLDHKRWWSTSKRRRLLTTDYPLNLFKNEPRRLNNVISSL
jgi:hypothetical protein